MHRLALVVVALAGVVACEQRNPQSCQLPDNMSKPECGGGGGPCQTNMDCASTPAFPFCDETDQGRVCVECTASDHTRCSGTKPRCEHDVCVACIDDNDCGDRGVCLPAGGCADSSRIIHAKVAGSTTRGCGALDNACAFATALLEVGPGRDVIRLDDAGPYLDDGFVIGVTVTIDARPATLRRTNNGPIVIVNNGSTVTLLGGKIEGAVGGGGDAIQCGGGATLTVDGTTMTANEESAIDSSGCTITVTNAKILGNGQAGVDINDGTITISRSMVAMNVGGGLLDGKAKFVIVGNLFVANGNVGAIFGGANVSTTKSGNRFEFNTIVANSSQATVAAGVQCTAMPGFVAQNNIIWNNNSALGPTGIEVGGGCLHDYSDVGPNPVPATLDGMHNKNVDPMFVNAASDLRPRQGSMVQRAANPDADLTGIAAKDLAGQPRTSPADIGAYQAETQ